MGFENWEQISWQDGFMMDTQKMLDDNFKKNICLWAKISGDKFYLQE